MMNAYDKDYLYHAQNTLGHMLDIAVNTCEIGIDDYFNMFIASDVCTQFENGNPAYIAGKTGCELVRAVIQEIMGTDIDEMDAMYLDKSPEFWLGWALAYYVWLKNYRFEHILNAVSASEMIGMYDTLHEADISKFVDAMDSILAGFYTQTALQRYRVKCGLSQAELAKRADVSVRMIQNYEQRIRDINKASAGTVLSIARVLNCNVEDILE